MASKAFIPCPACTVGRMHVKETRTHNGRGDKLQKPYKRYRCDRCRKVYSSHQLGIEEV